MWLIEEMRNQGFCFVLKKNKALQEMEGAKGVEKVRHSLRDCERTWEKRYAGEEVNFESKTLRSKVPQGQRKNPCGGSFDHHRRVSATCKTKEKTRKFYHLWCTWRIFSFMDPLDKNLCRSLYWWRSLCRCRNSIWLGCWNKYPYALKYADLHWISHAGIVINPSQGISLKIFNNPK